MSPPQAFLQKKISKTPQITSFHHGLVNQEFAQNPEYANGGLLQNQNFWLNKSRHLCFRNGFDYVDDNDGAVATITVDSNVNNPLQLVFFDFKITIYSQNNFGQFIKQAHELVSPYSASEATELVTNCGYALYGDFLFLAHQNHYPYCIDFGQSVVNIFPLKVDSGQRISIPETKRPMIRPRNSICANYFARLDTITTTSVTVEFVNSSDATLTPEFAFNVGDLIGIEGVLLDDGNKSGELIVKVTSVIIANKKYQCRFIIINATSNTNFLSGMYNPTNITVQKNYSGNPIGNHDYPLWNVEAWTGKYSDISNPSQPSDYTKSSYPSKVEKIYNRIVFGGYNGELEISYDNNPFDFSYGVLATSAFVGYVNFDNGVTDPVVNIFTVFYNGADTLAISNGRQTKICTISGSNIDITQLGFTTVNLFDGGISNIRVASTQSETSIAYLDRTNTEITIGIYNYGNQAFQPINTAQKNSDIMVGIDGNPTKVKQMFLSQSFMDVFYFLKEDGTLGNLIYNSGYNQEIIKAFGNITLGTDTGGNLSMKIISISTMDIKTSQGIENLLWAVVQITNQSTSAVFTKLCVLRQESYLANRFIDDSEFLDFKMVFTNVVANKLFTGLPDFMHGQKVRYYDYTNDEHGEQVVNDDGTFFLVDSASNKIAVGLPYLGMLETTQIQDPESGMAFNKYQGIEGVELGLAFSKEYPRVGTRDQSNNELYADNPSYGQNKYVRTSDNTKQYYKYASIGYDKVKSKSNIPNRLTTVLIKHDKPVQLNITSLKCGIYSEG